ncbi:MAG: hemerythrin domain-containing protein [Alphaproteobacteria bacterium]|nr:hemerythrin domain-containing protein [Alphaproteobacteria bacterium]
MRKREPLSLELIPENLLREPIEYIFADHYRLRQVVAAMDRLLIEGLFVSPLAEDNGSDVAVVRTYLVDELPIHIADEEEDLFPCLEQRCPGDGETGQILATLRQEHVEDFALLPPVTAGLDNLLAGGAVREGELFEASAARFVETQRRHIIWENNIVLPLARRYFTVDDMANMGHNMAARRNIEYPA